MPEKPKEIYPPLREDPANAIPPKTESDSQWVRFSHMRYRERFKSDQPLTWGDPVVLRTSRGIETGVVISDHSERPGDPEPIGEILRKMSPDDFDRAGEVPGITKGREYLFCREQIERLELPMKLIGVEHLFGGGKLIFYFVADGRVDFRELVRLLASEFRTRIEMKQVGVRDEARLNGSCNNCGRELCCRSFIREFKPITMKMAKNQKTTLDPSQLSGQCGRLKCCLRYEDEVYTELRRDLPRKKSRVKTPDGPAKVLSVEVILQKVIVELEDTGRVQTYATSTVERMKPRHEDGPRRQDDAPRRPKPDAGPPPADPNPGDAKS